MTILNASLYAGNLSLRTDDFDFSEIEPILDGEPVDPGAPVISVGDRTWSVRWPLTSGAGAAIVLSISAPPPEQICRLDLRIEGVDPERRISSLGLRIAVATPVLRYLRNGNTSWDGSYFVDPSSAHVTLDSDATAFSGYAMTALVRDGGNVVVLGFLRHDRFQSRLRFHTGLNSLSIDFETLIDRVAHSGEIAAESLELMAGSKVEVTLRRWASRVAQFSAVPARTQSKRIAGWCSWYNLYSAIDEPTLIEHLQAAARFRDQYAVSFDVFQIDDGFTPEMGDWLEVKPQFPRGMAPLLAKVREAGFVPGLWIAPFMVGNRSRLFAEHSDWIIRDHTGSPLVPMKFYGEFRWHKRSEEYYVLDITHPAAEAYIRNVFRIWRNDWGCGYFKTDFMYFGCEFGPEQANWHTPGMSRIGVWMRMARLIREEIGEAPWMSCGGPIWAPVGLVDAVRIGRDIGVTWHGHYSAESLLRDQCARNFAHGILWQADPDCILLRDRFHELTDREVYSLAIFSALSGGVLMTSDQLDEVPQNRRELLAEFARDSAVRTCDFPLLGLGAIKHRMVLDHNGKRAVQSTGDPVLVQRARRGDGTVLINIFNTGTSTEDYVVPWSLVECGSRPLARALHGSRAPLRTEAGVRVTVSPHDCCVLAFTPGPP